MMGIGHQLLNILMSELPLRDQSRQKRGDGGYLQGRHGVLGRKQGVKEEEIQEAEGDRLQYLPLLMI